MKWPSRYFGPPAGMIADSVPARLTPLRLVNICWASNLFVVGAYLWLWLQLRNLPFLDFPNHLARATVIADLLFEHGSHFAGAFTITLSPSPYLLGDLILASLVNGVGPSNAGPLWAALVFVSLPASIAYMARSLRLSAMGTGTTLLLGCYLGSSWFLLSGFFSFQLAVSLSVVVAANLFRQCESPSWGRLAAIVALTVAGYLIHLTMAVFVGAISLVVAIAYPTPLRQRALAASVPFFLAIALFVWSVSGPTDATRGASDWGSMISKSLRLFAAAVRFDVRSEVLCALPLAWIAWLTFRDVGKLVCEQRARLCVVMAATFLALYCVLPVSQGRIYDVDVRALAPMSISAVLAMLVVVDLGSRLVQVSAWAAAICLALANLWLLQHELSPLNRTIATYRALLLLVPERSSLLPVDAVPDVGRHQAFLHAGSWATTDRYAITPYIFSGSTAGPMAYFRYVHPPRAPSIFWAMRPGNRRPDCEQIARDFVYVAIIGERNLGCPSFAAVATSNDGPISILKHRGVSPVPETLPSSSGTPLDPGHGDEARPRSSQ
jgi:hypothetical protein